MTEEIDPFEKINEAGHGLLVRTVDGHKYVMQDVKAMGAFMVGTCHWSSAQMAGVVHIYHNHIVSYAVIGEPGKHAEDARAKEAQHKKMQRVLYDQQRKYMDKAVDMFDDQQSGEDWKG